VLKPTIFPDHEAMSQRAADCLAETVSRRPDALLCLAAGSTPQRAFHLFVDRGVHNPRLLDRVRLLKLDEWGGLPMDEPATCEQFLRECIVDTLKAGDRYAGFESNPGDPEAECRRIAAWLEQHGPIDTCVLGLGVNGHIGFNEPGPSLNPHAHVARLSETSLEHRMLLRTKNCPAYGLTLGMVDLLHSRQILLLISGRTKREPLRRLLDGPITTDFPASLLALHQNVEVFVDADALG
jgi:galactosamine-6-phosphate isomerase